MKCTHIITSIVIYWLCYVVSLLCVTCFFPNYRFSYHRLLLEILKGKQPRSSQELPCLVHRFYLRKKMKKLNQQLGGLFPLVCRAGLCWQVLSISDGKKDFFEIKIYLLLNWKVPSLRERCYAMQLFRELVSKGLYEITCLKLCQSATLQDKLPKSSSCKCRRGLALLQPCTVFPILKERFLFSASIPLSLRIKSKASCKKSFPSW